jgi:hypothetical protein
MSEVNVMREIFFWVYVVSAVLAFLYLFVFSQLAMIPIFKECEAKGMVRVKRHTSWVKLFISLIKSVLIIGLPVINTFFIAVWLCNTSECMETWEGVAWESFCYPDELP